MLGQLRFDEEGGKGGGVLGWLASWLARYAKGRPCPRSPGFIGLVLTPLIVALLVATVTTRHRLGQA